MHCPGSQNLYSIIRRKSPASLSVRWLMDALSPSRAYSCVVHDLTAVFSQLWQNQLSRPDVTTTAAAPAAFRPDALDLCVCQTCGDTSLSELRWPRCVLSTGGSFTKAFARGDLEKKAAFVKMATSTSEEANWGFKLLEITGVTRTLSRLP